MNVVSLDSIKGIGELTPATPSACASSCGGAAPEGLPAHILEKIRNHPCYSEEAHHYFARMHLSVAPACNIQCNYCNRKFDCSNESRPGVVSERLTPDEAVKKALAVAAEVPQLSVIGIAGPGDSLAAGAKATLETFRRLSERLPDVKFCLSTNGLALPDHIEDLKALNIDHVTITINMIDAEVGERIYPWIYFDGKRRTGREASQILHERQMEGLEALAAAGILVKINSVLIPGVNDEHLSAVNAAVRARGAFLHNIMPLISDPAHGTHFGLTGQRGPTTSELKAVQDRCEGSIKLMRHCRQCRADAIGLLGHDRGEEFSKEKVAVMEERDGAEDRAAYRLHVEEERAERERIREAASAEAADHTAVAPILVAVATKGGNRINEHFGHAREFQVYEVGPSGAKFVGHRRVDHYCSDGYGEEEVLPATIRALADCRAVLVAKIGSCPSKSLTEAGIEPVSRYAYEFIEESALDYFAAFAAEAKSGTLRPAAAADGEIRQGAFVARRA